MKSHSDDTTELVIVLPPDPTLDSSPVNPLILRRAFRHGQRASGQFPDTSFDDAEAELRAAWLLNGETSRWRDVRDSVRLGFEEEDTRGR